MRSIFAFSSWLLIPLLVFGANRPGTNATNSFYVGVSTQFTTNPVLVSGLSTAPITPLVERTWDGSLDWPKFIAARPTHSDQSDYTWTALNTKMNTVNGYSGRLVYTMGVIPSWVTGNSADTACHTYGGNNYLGTCYPPTDVSTACTAQGSLSGQTFSDNCMAREFIKDLLTHATANGTPIWAIELANEPNFCGNSSVVCDAASTNNPGTAGSEWIGTIAQLVAFNKAVATQARATQPGIVLIGPSTTTGSVANCTTLPSGEAFLNSWLGSYSGPTLDYVSVHLYPGSPVENIDTRITNVKACVNLSSAATLFTTEGSWGNTITNGCGVTGIVRATNVDTFTCSGGHFLTVGNVGQNIQIGGTATGTNATSFDGTYAIASVPNSTTFTVAQVAIDDSTSTGQGNAVLTAQLALQADYLSRWFLIQFSRGVKGAVWYSAYNNNWGTLCQKFNASVCQDATVSPARVAAGEMYKWLADATASGTCSTNGTVWTCNYTKADGYTSQAVWDTSGASTYTFPAGYTQYRDTTGATNLLSGTTQAIGTTPILLENLPRQGRKY